jgi:signal transduction histidine kinase
LRSNSLAARLLFAAALWVTIVLTVTGLTLSSYYQGLVERGFDQRLNVYLKTLVGGLARESELEQVDFNIGEPRFELPLSGWYWQIGRRDGSGSPGRSSPSLFDRNLTFLIDQDPEKDETATREAYVQGPDKEEMRQIERIIQVGSARYIVTVAGETSEIAAEVEAFNSSLLTTFVLLGLGLVLSAAIQVLFGLRPLKKISAQIADIRAGRSLKLEGDVPAEVAPLARELNALLEGNRDIVHRARTQAGNLAHAVKTPLSVILNETAQGADPSTEKIREQAVLMRQQIDHHLDRARVSAGVLMVGVATEVRPILEALARTMTKVHRDRDLQIDVQAGEALFRGERQDLEEMVGNLLDNACKWATGRIVVSLSGLPSGGVDGQASLTVTVDDDGPGLDAEQREQAMARGQRLDETKPGSGLGLAIVSELAALYGGVLQLAASPMGGLRAELRLPMVVA